MNPVQLCAKAREFHVQLLEDLKVNELNLREKTLECPAIKAKWLMTFMAEKRCLNVLEIALEDATGKYVREHGKEGVPKIKTTMESKSNEHIQKIRKAISEQKEVVEYLDGVMKIVYAFGFEIKNILALLQLEH